MLLRGDTAFSQTTYFDRWDDDGLRFIVGYDASAPMMERAETVEDSEYRGRVRRADHVFAGASATGGSSWSAPP